MIDQRFRSDFHSCFAEPANLDYVSEKINYSIKTYKKHKKIQTNSFNSSKQKSKKNCSTLLNNMHLMVTSMFFVLLDLAHECKLYGCIHVLTLPQHVYLFTCKRAGDINWRGKDIVTRKESCAHRLRTKYHATQPSARFIHNTVFISPKG